MKKILISVFFLTIVCCLLSCTREDHYYKDLIDGKDIVHPGRINNVSYSSGHNRFALDFVLSKDRQVRDIVVYWNKKADSLIVKVDESEIGHPKQVLVENMPEDSYDIEIYTQSLYGDRSIPTKISGRVYGNNYISGLNNRAFLQGGFSGGRAWLEWVPETREDYLYTKITYTTINEQTIELEMPKGTEWRYFDNYKRGTKVYYQSAFQPVEKTLDTYFSEINEVIVPE